MNESAGTLTQSDGRDSSVVPLPRDLLNHIVRAAGVKPKDLNCVGAPNLHFQPAAGWRELQMFLARPDRDDDAEGDLGHVRTISGGFDSRDRTRDHRRVPPVELRPLRRPLVWVTKRVYLAWDRYHQANGIWASGRGSLHAPFASGQVARHRWLLLMDRALAEASLP